MQVYIRFSEIIDDMTDAVRDKGLRDDFLIEANALTECSGHFPNHGTAL